ncbi:MAG: vWA domain-containing protein [Fimbriimonadales bacterium]
MIGLVLVVIIAVIAALGWWLWSYSRSQVIQTPLALGAGFDVSESMRKDQKQRAVAFLNKMIGEVMPTRTPTKIWRFAENVETVHESRPIASKELMAVSRETIENHMGKWGTRPDKVMGEFERYLQQDGERKYVLCLFTDGECHDAARTREQAARLAEDNRVVAVVVGPVINRYRRAVENDYYAPLREAGKLLVFGETDAHDALARLKERLNQLKN